MYTGFCGPATSAWHRQADCMMLFSILRGKDTSKKKQRVLEKHDFTGKRPFHELYVLTRLRSIEDPTERSPEQEEREKESQICGSYDARGRRV